MKLKSNVGFAQLIVGILIFFIVFIVLIIAVNSSLSCVNEQGCLRSWCRFDWLKQEYKVLVTKQNKLCPYQITDELTTGTEDQDGNNQVL